MIAVGVQLPLVTVSAMVVDAVSVPDVPVMVTVDVPGVAVPLAVRYSTPVVGVGSGANEAVTPEGKPDAARDTVPVNPPRPVTAIVDVLVTPWLIDREAGADPRVKLSDPVGCTVTIVLADAVVPPAPVQVSE